MLHRFVKFWIRYEKRWYDCVRTSLSSSGIISSGTTREALYLWTNMSLVRVEPTMKFENRWGRCSEQMPHRVLWSTALCYHKDIQHCIRLDMEDGTWMICRNSMFPVRYQEDGSCGYSCLHHRCFWAPRIAIRASRMNSRLVSCWLWCWLLTMPTAVFWSTGPSFSYKSPWSENTQHQKSDNTWRQDKCKWYDSAMCRRTCRSRSYTILPLLIKYDQR